MLWPSINTAFFRNHEQGIQGTKQPKSKTVAVVWGPESPLASSYPPDIETGIRKHRNEDWTRRGKNSPSQTKYQYTYPHPTASFHFRSHDHEQDDGGLDIFPEHLSRFIPTARSDLLARNQLSYSVPGCMGAERRKKTECNKRDERWI